MGVGRPSKLTPEVSKKLIQAVETGVPYKHAAVFAGIGYSTFQLWMQKGREAKTGEFREFFEEIEEANARALVVNLATIKQAGKEDWRALAWIVERRFPEEFGKQIVEQRHANRDGSGPVEVEHSGAVLAIPVDPASLSRLSDDELAAMKATIAKMRETAEG